MLPVKVPKCQDCNVCLERGQSTQQKKVEQNKWTPTLDAVIFLIWSHLNKGGHDAVWTTVWSGAVRAVLGSRFGQFLWEGALSVKSVKSVHFKQKGVVPDSVPFVNGSGSSLSSFTS